MSAGTVYQSAASRLLAETHPRQAVESPDAAGLDELRRQLTTVCESAVDALEIAASLEADGLSDQTVRARYGFLDVFALGEHLFRAVPRRPVEPPAPPERWQANRGEHVVLGLLYALPAVCFPVAAPLLAGAATLVGFVVSTVASWALSQGLAYLGYARAGRLDPGGALWILRGGTGVALVALWGTVAASALLVPAPIGGLLFASGQGTYLLAATVLLVRGKHRWLVCCLAPGVLASAGFLALGRPAWLASPVWCALGTSVVVTLGCAAGCTARPGRAARRWPPGYELRAALPYALFGLAAAGMLTYPVVASQLTGKLPGLAPLLATPLSLSMGAAEGNLYWYRRRTYRLLNATLDPTEFASRSQWTLLAATARYVAAAAVLIAATAGVVAVTGHLTLRWTTLVECAAFLALGGALFVALLLQAFGGSLVTPLACTTALGVEITLTAVAGVDPVPAQLLSCAALAAVLLGYAGRALSEATRHG